MSHLTRRLFLQQSSLSLGGIALGHLERPDLFPRPAKAKRVIYIHLAGSPSTLEMFDWKPKLVEMNGKPCPDSLLQGERFAFIKGHP